MKSGRVVPRQIHQGRRNRRHRRENWSAMGVLIDEDKCDINSEAHESVHTALYRGFPEP